MNKVYAPPTLRQPINYDIKKDINAMAINHLTLDAAAKEQK